MPCGDSAPAAPDPYRKRALLRYEEPPIENEFLCGSAPGQLQVALWLLFIVLIHFGCNFLAAIAADVTWTNALMQYMLVVSPSMALTASTLLQLWPRTVPSLRSRELAGAVGVAAIASHCLATRGILTFPSMPAWLAVLLVGYLCIGVRLHIALLTFVPSTVISLVIGFILSNPGALHICLETLVALASHAIGLLALYGTQRETQLCFEKSRTTVRCITELVEENANCEQLARCMLPPSIVHRMLYTEQPIEDHYPMVTILFSDLVGFTSWAGSQSPIVVVDMLRALFVAFDDRAEQYGVEKIKTIGDAYWAVGGMNSEAAPPRAASAVAALGLAMMLALQELRDRRGLTLQMRIGIHSGPVIAGLMGHRKLSYDVFGMSNKIAQEMEITSRPDHIQVTETTRELVGSCEGVAFEFEIHTLVPVPCGGSIQTYWLLSKVRGGAWGAPVVEPESPVQGAGDALLGEPRDVEAPAFVRDSTAIFTEQVGRQSSSTPLNAEEAIAAPDVLQGLGKIFQRSRPSPRAAATRTCSVGHRQSQVKPLLSTVDSEDFTSPIPDAQPVGPSRQNVQTLATVSDFDRSMPSGVPSSSSPRSGALQNPLSPGSFNTGCSSAGPDAASNAGFSRILAIQPPPPRTPSPPGGGRNRRNNASIAAARVKATKPDEDPAPSGLAIDDGDSALKEAAPSLPCPLPGSFDCEPPGDSSQPARDMTISFSLNGCLFSDTNSTVRRGTAESGHRPLRLQSATAARIQGVLDAADAPSPPTGAPRPRRVAVLSPHKGESPRRGSVTSRAAWQMPSLENGKTPSPKSLLLSAKVDALPYRLTITKSVSPSRDFLCFQNSGLEALFRQAAVLLTLPTFLAHCVIGTLLQLLVMLASIGFKVDDLAAGPLFGAWSIVITALFAIAGLVLLMVTRFHAMVAQPVWRGAVACLYFVLALSVAVITQFYRQAVNGLSVQQPTFWAELCAEHAVALTLATYVLGITRYIRVLRRVVLVREQCLGLLGCFLLVVVVDIVLTIFKGAVASLPLHVLHWLSWALACLPALVVACGNEFRTRNLFREQFSVDLLKEKSERQRNLSSQLIACQFPIHMISRIQHYLRSPSSEVICEFIPEASVLFASFQELVDEAVFMDPRDGVALLNALCSMLDESIVNYPHLEKIKTISGVYMVAGGFMSNEAVQRKVDTHDRLYAENLRLVGNAERSALAVVQPDAGMPGNPMLNLSFTGQGQSGRRGRGANTPAAHANPLGGSNSKADFMQGFDRLEVGRFALDVMRCVATFKDAHDATFRRRIANWDDLQMKVKIGFTFGPAVGAVIGQRRCVYDIFGPTVNLASRLMSSAPPNTIQVSEKHANYITQYSAMRVEGPREVELKGIGVERVYVLAQENDNLGL